MKPEAVGWKYFLAAYILCILLLAVLRGPWLLTMMNRYYEPRMGRDFRGNFYLAGLTLKDGFWDIYDSTKWEVWLKKRGLPPADSWYPPLALVVHVPFVSLPPWSAQILYFRLNLLLLFITSMVFFCFAGLDWGKKQKLMHVFLALPLMYLCAPTIDGLFAGQISFLLLFLMTVFYLAYVNGRFGWAACAMTLAASLKIAPGIFFLYFVRKKDWKSLGYALFFMIFWVMPVIIYSGSLKLFIDYFCKLPAVADPWLVFNNQSFSSFIGKFFMKTDFWSPIMVSPFLYRFFYYVLVVASILLTFSLVCSGSRDKDRLRLEISAVLLLQLLCIGRSWPHHHVYVLLCFGLMYLVVRGKYEKELIGCWNWVTYLIIALMILDGEIGWGMEDYLLRMKILSWHIPFFLLLALWGINLYMLGRLRYLEHMSDGKLLKK